MDFLSCHDPCVIKCEVMASFCFMGKCQRQYLTYKEEGQREGRSPENCSLLQVDSYRINSRSQMQNQSKGVFEREKVAYAKG